MYVPLCKGVIPKTIFIVLFLMTFSIYLKTNVIHAYGFTEGKQVVVVGYYIRTEVSVMDVYSVIIKEL